MPPAGVMVVCALAAIGYVFIGRPVVKGVKKVGHGVCHVVTIGKECKAKPKH